MRDYEVQTARVDFTLPNDRAAPTLSASASIAGHGIHITSQHVLKAIAFKIGCTIKINALYAGRNTVVEAINYGNVVREEIFTKCNLNGFTARSRSKSPDPTPCGEGALRAMR